mmetsp:Transcript_29949/g.96643  ORF Transcript_29949/g.96643 Transcript_29949/m.96643 type:complete len:143 (-) Transcript_29949:405-833(-)
MWKVLLTLLSAASAHGLRIAMVARPNLVARASPALMAITDKADACLKEECSLDMVHDLILELQMEAERLSRKGTSTSKEQVECLLMLGRLQALNQNHAANKSEIEKIVASLGRSFGKTEDYDFPGESLGYTGTINRSKKGLD